MTDEINELANTAGRRPAWSVPDDAENRRLREACQQFEGLLLGIILKESLRETFKDSEDDAGVGMEQFRDFCVEQVANSMAESSSLGIAEQLYEQFTQHGVSP